MKAHTLIGSASGSLRDVLLIHARLQFPSHCLAAAPFHPWAHVLAAIPSLLPPLCVFRFIAIVGNSSNRPQPVYDVDVAECVRTAVFEGAHAGKTYELNGPEQLTTYEISRCVCFVCVCVCGGKWPRTAHHPPDR
jgi:hypothetical protein